MESGEIIYEKVYVSPRPPPTISFKDNWMKELDSEVTESSKDTQRIQPKPNTQLPRTGRPVGEQQFTQKIEKDVLFGREGTKHSTRTVRPRRRKWTLTSDTRIVTCSCERSRKFPCSRTREDDRKSSSSRSSLQPIQQQFESDDP